MTSVDLEFDQLNSTVDALRRSISNRLMYGVGKDAVTAQPRDWLHAVELAVRDRLVARWMRTTRQQYEQDVKRVYYLSMEFLIGRTFTQRAARARHPRRGARRARGPGRRYQRRSKISSRMPRSATAASAVWRRASSIRWRPSAFRASATASATNTACSGRRSSTAIRSKRPITGCARAIRGSFRGPRSCTLVHFGGRTVQHDDRTEWIDTEHVNAMAYDTVIPGFATTATNTLRLWSARATDEFDLSAFNQGDYRRAVEAKNTSEHVSRLLYPDDSTQAGRELRLRQEYFFVSATMQDLIRRYQRTHSHFGRLAEKVAVHLNDTHPVLAIPELMRLLRRYASRAVGQGVEARAADVLVHEPHADARSARNVGRRDARAPAAAASRNHLRHQRAVPQAGRPRSSGRDVELIRRISLVDEYGQRRVRMAHLAIVASHKVNGVSKLHSQLMTQNIFSDFARMYPERFTNVTNGITPRRWLAQASPSLSSLIDERLGPRWRTDLVRARRVCANGATIPSSARPFTTRSSRTSCGSSSARSATTGAIIDPDALFDLQVKRIHEYKRQLLNILHVIVRYNRIREEPERDWTPRVVMFAGKAASAYKMAKNIIKLINDVAKKINADPLVGDRLKVGFIPNYGVSVAELIIPAADLSQQISMAGTEASGTGNMKLALNGALTIGTLDGANIEICDAVGRENMFIFGHSTDEIEVVARGGLSAAADLRGEPGTEDSRSTRSASGISRRTSRIASTTSSTRSWTGAITTWCSPTSTASTRRRPKSIAKFRDKDAWTRSAIENVAGMGIFSSDRTIAEYAQRNLARRAAAGDLTKRSVPRDTDHAAERRVGEMRGERADDVVDVFAIGLDIERRAVVETARLDDVRLRERAERIREHFARR